MTETVIDDADSVSADGGAVSADAGSASADAGHLSDLKPKRSARQDQNRDAAARRREWRKRGLVVFALKSSAISTLIFHLRSATQRSRCLTRHLRISA
jgi:hypothetical protein